MKHEPQHATNKRSREQKRGKRWQKIVGAMAAVVVFCTTYAMILPALTLEKDASDGVVPAAADNVTVSFVISDENYTQDSGSGNTHITSKTDQSNTSEGLTFTSWASRYKVTGTGTLASFTIPAGTSLADNAYSLPSISVENIGSENAATYLSSRSWITSSGMICNANTTFDSDTELDLCLYQDGENCSLNYVCGDESDHSVTYAVSGYPSPVFKLGQSVSDPYIPTAEDVNAKYNLSWCSHGSKSNEVFAGWYLKDSDGNEVPFKAGVALTSQYLDPDATSTVKVYAYWKDAAAEETTYTVAFVYGDKTIETRPVDEGAALGALPDMSEYESETSEFVEWRDSEGNVVTAETVVTADMTLTAVFRDPTEVVYYNVVLHDIDVDGNESAVTIDLSVEEGTTLADALAEGGATLEDGTDPSGCVWHNGTDGDTVALTDAVASDMELYTYTYRLTLTLQEPRNALAAVMSFFSARSVDVSDDGNTLTLTLREGEKPSYSDFVVDGVDYSTATWTYTENGTQKTLSISNLIENGATQTITATAAPSELSTTDISINYYVCINDEWTKAGETSKAFGPATGWGGGNNQDRYYVTIGILDQIYSPYGFDASTYNGQRWFPHCGSGGNTIWSNAGPVQTNGIWRIPVGDVKKAYDIYYTPDSLMSGDSESITAAKTGNTFYTVDVLDPSNTIYDEGEAPETQYVLTGNNFSITLKGSKDDWDVSDSSATKTDNADGTVTIAFSSVTAPILIKPAGQYIIRYLIEPDESELERIGGKNSTYTASEQSWANLPTIAGVNDKQVVVNKTDGHTVLSPDSQIASTKTSNAAMGEFLATYSFVRWKINGSTNSTVAANETIDADWLEANAVNGVVTLTPDWSANPESAPNTSVSTGDSTRENTVSFWVITTSSSSDADSDSISVGTTSDKYSDCVYSAAVYGGDGASLQDYGSQRNALIAAGANDELSTVKQVDSTIRNLSTGDGYSGVTLSSFPSDEEVLARLRTWGDRVHSGSTATITVDGNDIPLSELTTENYTIRWYVFKYDDSDGWHVDGKLVPKVGRLTVTKTFYGDEDAINAVKASENYSIAATPSDPSCKTYNLSLNAAGDETDSSKTGYTRYVPDTNTYVWVLDVIKNVNYTVTETGYTYSDDNGNIATVAEYLVSNSDGSGAGKWTNYTSAGVTVAAKTYPEDVSYKNYQTVSLVNSYLEKSSLLVRKVDSATGYTLGGVSFTLRKNSKDGDICHVWSVPGTNKYYLYDPSDSGITDAEKDSSGTVTGDSRGYFEIVGLKDESRAGTYVLVEGTAPEGYSRLVNPIVMNVASDGSVTLANTVSSDEATIVPEDESGLILRVYNKALSSSVVATKVWSDGTNRPVTFQLYRNGTTMGNAYKVTLDGTVDTVESSAWQVVWSDLPLYVDGAAAKYTIQETWIGGEGTGDHYDSTVDDGYANYTVTTPVAVYEYQDGTISKDPSREKTDDAGNTETEYANYVRLTVQNRVNNGEVTFAKIDENGKPVPGATFTLYSDEAHTQVVAAQTSGEDGIVTFTDIVPGEYYLMRETGTPAGYINDDTVYTVSVTGLTSHIKDSEGNEMNAGITNQTDQAAVVLKKVDASNNLLTGSKFQLYKLNGTAYEAYVDTTNGFDGQPFEVTGGSKELGNLKAGTYKLVETEAPAGYNIMTKGIVFTIDNLKVSSPEGTDGDWTIAGPDETTGAYTITAVNHAGEELPMTGGIGTHWYTAGGAMLLALALLCGFMLRRKPEGGDGR